MKKVILITCAVLSLSGCAIVSDPNLCDKPEHNYPGSVCDLAHG